VRDLTDVGALFRYETWGVDAWGVTEFIIHSKTDNVGRQVVHVVCKSCEVPRKSVSQIAVGSDAVKSHVQVFGFTDQL